MRQRQSVILASRAAAVVAAVIATAVLASGCGGGRPTTRPLASLGAVTFPQLGYKPHPPALPAGIRSTTALAVDFGDQGGVQPASMRLASDTSATRLQWSDWGAPTATATGTAIVHICTSSCGAGYDRNYPALISLSDLRVCDHRHRFYSRIHLTLRTRKGNRPWGAFLRSPCQ